MSDLLQVCRQIFSILRQTFECHPSDGSKWRVNLTFRFKFLTFFFHPQATLYMLVSFDRLPLTLNEPCTELSDGHCIFLHKIFDSNLFLICCTLLRVTIFDYFLKVILFFYCLPVVEIKTLKPIQMERK